MTNPEEPIPSHANPDLAKLARAVRSGANRARASAHRRTIVAGFVLVTTLSIVAALTLPLGSRPTAVASPGPGTTGDPNASVEPWTGLTLAPDQPLARLTADDVAARQIPAASTFTLRSLRGAPAMVLARGLRVEPPTTFELIAGPTADTVTVRPTAALTDGTRYRFRLYAPDGSLAGTWAFRTTSPLRAVALLPDDQTVNVPVNTGIEIGFDQDTPGEIASHFSIVPAVQGRFELHGRTWAFVPATPLKAQTLYSVTVTRGVAVSGSDQVLEADVRWQFETAPIDATADRPPVVGFGRTIVEARPSAPVDLVLGFGGEASEAPKTVPMDLYRLPSRAAAVDAARRLLDSPGWATWSSNTSVDPAGLTRVVHANLAFDPVQNGRYYHVRLPAPLDRGWYLAVIPSEGHPAQALLQVSNLGVYAQASETRSIAWAVDLSTVTGVPGVVVSRTDGTEVGRTGASGLMNIATPADLSLEGLTTFEDRPAPTRLLVAIAPNGAQLIVPLGMPGDEATPGGQMTGRSEANDYWTLLATERGAYRRTDTVRAWGLARARDDRSVPGELELRLHLSGSTSDAPIARVPVTADGRGVFTGAIGLDNLPTGNYDLDLFAGAARLMSTSIQVEDIRKPLYRLDVTTDHRAYLVGQAIAITTSAIFFDGTAAPGLDLQISDGPTGTTDGNGRFVVSIPATLETTGTPSGRYIGVVPAGPEEGDIVGTTGVTVLPSTVWLSADASVTEGRIVLSGRAGALDLAKADRELATDGNLVDPTSGPLAGHVVLAKVIHEVPVRRQVGTSYDFVEKRVVPIYEYTTRLDVLATRSLTTDALGRFGLSLTAPVVDDSYYIELSSKDAKGRSTELTAYAAQVQEVFADNLPPYLDSRNTCGWWNARPIGLDEPASVTFHDGDGSVPSSGSFLFLVARQGLEDAVVQSSAGFSRLMADADLPGFVVMAVHATPAGLSPAGSILLTVDPKDKAITVTMTPDRSRYAPGDHATIGIRTTDGAGHGIAADVVVRGVDEKLFSIGLAGDINAREALYGYPGSGLLQSFASHVLPTAISDGCGDEGGREDFRDTALFTRVVTDASGHGTVAFDLPDDLTSWHVSATALSSRLDVGGGSVLLPVGLPFFVDATLASDYLVGEKPVVRLRTFGDSLRTGQSVHVTVSAPTLGLPPVEAQGDAFGSIRITLPALPAGDHRITIEARLDGSSPAVTDKIIRTVHVISTRLRQLEHEQAALTAGLVLPGGDGLTTYVISDAGRGRLLPLLQQLSDTASARFDATVAADIARRILIDEFELPESELRPSGFDPGRYEHDGIALLPYSSTDLFLSASAALVAPDRIHADLLRNVLFNWATEAVATRERRIVALAGLAGLGDDELTDLRAFDASTLTIRERLWLGLGLLASGDEDGARQIERDLLASYGQRLGSWIRLNAGVTLETTLEASGLLLLLAGGLGDPLAPDVSLYLQRNDSSETLFNLQQLGYVRAMLDRLPRTPASFAWTLDGERHEVALKAGESFALTLTASQRAQLRLETLTGELVVTSSWLRSTTAADLPHDATVTIRRTVTPAGDAPADALVTVRLDVSLGATAPSGCYRVTDVLPSGLAPVARLAPWPDFGGPEPERDAVLSPYEIDGQFVSWCVDRSRPGWVLGYRARVVSPGTYTWEPAVIQSEDAPTIGSATLVTTYTIR